MGSVASPGTIAGGCINTKYSRSASGKPGLRNYVLPLRPEWRRIIPLRVPVRFRPFSVQRYNTASKLESPQIGCGSPKRRWRVLVVLYIARSERHRATVGHSSGTTWSLKTGNRHAARRFSRTGPSRLAGLVHLGKQVALCGSRAGLAASPAP